MSCLELARVYNEIFLFYQEIRHRQVLSKQKFYFISNICDNLSNHEIDICYYLNTIARKVKSVSRKILILLTVDPLSTLMLLLRRTIPLLLLTLTDSALIESLKGEQNL